MTKPPDQESILGATGNAGDKAFFQHPMALVESDQIGQGTRIWAFAQVMQGARIGSNVNVGGHSFIESGAFIGNDVTIKNHVCVWDGITIEDGAFIGPRVTFTNDNLPRSARNPACAHRYSSPDQWLVKTTVGFGCSIGAAVTIAPGVRLGAGCMIGAGTVVTKDVPPFALIVGTPNRHLGDVCLCGERLSGNYDSVDCEHCGQTSENRKKIAYESIRQQSE